MNPIHLADGLARLFPTESPTYARLPLRDRLPIIFDHRDVRAWREERELARVTFVRPDPAFAAVVEERRRNRPAEEFTPVSRGVTSGLTASDKRLAERIKRMDAAKMRRDERIAAASRAAEMERARAERGARKTKAALHRGLWVSPWEWNDGRWIRRRQEPGCVGAAWKIDKYRPAAVVEPAGKGWIATTHKACGGLCRRARSEQRARDVADAALVAAGFHLWETL